MLSDDLFSASVRCCLLFLWELPLSVFIGNGPNGFKLIDIGVRACKIAIDWNVEESAHGT